MTLPQKLVMALAFGFGAVAVPAALIVFEAAHTSRPERHDAAYARSLLSQGRLAWEDHRAMAGGSAVHGFAMPESGSGY